MYPQRRARLWLAGATAILTAMRGSSAMLKLTTARLKQDSAEMKGIARIGNIAIYRQEDAFQRPAAAMLMRTVAKVNTAIREAMRAKSHQIPDFGFFFLFKKAF